IADIEPYVLRYWETEFPFLKPRKNKSEQRVYTKKDLELILEIKRLLYQERYTIEGVRKRFALQIQRGYARHAAESKAADTQPLGCESQRPDKILEHVRKRLRETRIEGPFGDHTGFYSPAEPYPVFHVTCITHRKDMLYPTTLVGKPPMEDCYMGKATERIFLPLLRLDFPEIKDINLPMEGVFHNFALISIKKSYTGHAKKIIHGLWGKGQRTFAKRLIVVGDDV
ncbi:4-hydroxy-3-polyprenylbenzoate decarboxylase, partial [Candidatus Hakubella thermalkaliphila]